MAYIDLNKPSKVHFLGIGGISMSGFAELLLKRGFTVTGSDSKASVNTERLEKLGARVVIGQKAENITDDIDVAVYTGAIKQDNPELVRARELNIPVIERGTLVGDVMLNYSRNFAIAGTHGKTTTTSMLSLILIQAGADPTVSVGGILDNIGGNIRIGDTGDFVCEACEYTDSFLKFHPTHAIITNVEAEHLDYFGTLERMRESFAHFAGLLPADGLLVYNYEIPDNGALFEHTACRKISYSAVNTSADYYAGDINYDDKGMGRFTLYHNGEPIGRIKLSVPGTHNIANAAGAAVMALESGIPYSAVCAALDSYSGTERRFQRKGEFSGVTVIDDYAHHPTEVKATLQAASCYPHGRIVTVFQPHTYSRTAAFKEELAEALSASDIIVMADIYAAREVNTFGISSGDIADILSSKYGKEVYYFSTFEEIEEFLLKKCVRNDLLITMGAGDVVVIGERLLAR